MKSIIVPLVMVGVLAGGESLAQSKPSLGVRLGFDLPGEFEQSLGGMSMTSDVGMGLSLALEVAATQQATVTAGLGVEFQMRRTIDHSTLDPKFDFMPIYGFVMFNGNPSNPAPFGVIRLGYSLVHSGNSDYKGSADLSGGLAFAIGGGSRIGNKMRVEATYELNMGQAEFGGSTIDLTYSRLRFGWGFGF